MRARIRSRGLIVLAALLVLGFGVATVMVVTRAGDKASVLAVGTAVSKGQVVERDDLVSQAVAGVPGAIPITDVEAVVGQTATVDLVVGQILTGAMLSTSPTPGAGESLVGLSLDPTRVPSAGLEPGDVVRVVAAAGGQDGDAPAQGLDKPAVLADQATVYAVEGTAADGGQLLLTLVVDAEAADRVAAYSTAGRVALVEVAPGTSGGGG